jgi:hypothetical protein
VIHITDSGDLIPVATNRRLLTIAAAALAAALLAGGCDDRGGSRSTQSSATIPQPPLLKLNARTRRRLAPESKRVDLTVPSFSNPTQITNPLFPIGELRSALLLGRLDRKPWRAETTLLPKTAAVDWNGTRIETLRSQFVAYLDGRIYEVAVDRYAQADDGAVWYLGEDAFSYEHGRVASTEGTWLAGVDGPPAMIMPGQPRVGDVYRTENVPGLVFEQVTVKRLGVTVNGPSGPVDGAMIGQEVHMDEARLEDKTFAPGYGEFHSGEGRTFEATALAVPADAVSAPIPAALKMLTSRAGEVFDNARAKDWKAASAGVARLTTAWDRLRARDVPTRLASQLDDAVGGLANAVAARSSERAPQAALDVANASLDLELRYRPPVQVDLARFGLWTRRLEAYAAAGNAAGVAGDAVTLHWIRRRIPLSGSIARRADDGLRHVEAAAEAGALTAAADAAGRLRSIVVRAAT